MDFYNTNPLSVLMPVGGDPLLNPPLTEILSYFNFAHYELLRMQPSFMAFIEKSLDKSRNGNMNADYVVAMLLLSEDSKISDLYTDSKINIGSNLKPSSDAYSDCLQSYLKLTHENYKHFHTCFSTAFHVYHLLKTFLTYEISKVMALGGSATVNATSGIDLSIRKISLMEMYYGPMEKSLKHCDYYHTIMRNFR